MGARKKRDVSQGYTGRLEAEPKAGSPVFLGIQDSQDGGHSSKKEAMEPQVCCSNPHPHPKVRGQVLLSCPLAAMTPSLPSH